MKSTNENGMDETGMGDNGMGETGMVNPKTGKHCAARDGMRTKLQL